MWYRTIFISLYSTLRLFEYLRHPEDPADHAHPYRSYQSKITSKSLSLAHKASASMAFFRKFQTALPPTSTDAVTDPTTSPVLDPEKSEVQGKEIEAIVQAREHHVHPEMERKVVRKMDFRIIPLVTALYVLSFLDRSNIGKYVIIQTCCSPLHRYPRFEYAQHVFQGFIYLT